MNKTILVAVAVLLGLAMSPAQALTTVTFGEEHALSAMTSAVGLAKGFFKEEGIHLKLEYAQRGTDKIQAALAGQLDFGYSGSPPIISAVSRGAPIVMIGLFSHGYSGILVGSKKLARLRGLPPKQVFEELRGKRIGIQIGSGVATVFLMTIDALGFHRSDYQIRNIRVADMPGAMQSGTFDAVVGWEPGMSRIVSSGYGVKIMEPKDFEKAAKITYAFPLFTTKKFVDEHPALVQRFMNAWAKSQHYADTHHKESLRILRNALGSAVSKLSDRDLANLAYIYQKDRVAFTDADIQDIRSMSQFMFKEGEISKKPDISETVNNSFATKAQQAVYGN